MWNSIKYKEWLKLRWIALGLLVVGMLLEIGFYSTVRHSMILGNANQYWHNIVFRDAVFYRIFKFFPLIAGLITGLAQYLPEIRDKRIKLTLHLPAKEEKLILWMVLCGTAILIAVYVLLIALFALIGSYFFPIQIISQSVCTMLPWFLAGLAAYNLTACITMEPLWLQRIIYAALAAAMVNLFFITNKFCAYRTILPWIILFTTMTSISDLYSIYRFRKGEM